MDAEKIERIYRKALAKGQADEIQYVSGYTLQRMFAIAGKRIDTTTEGHIIEPDIIYALTNAGVFRVD